MVQDDAQDGQGRPEDGRRRSAALIPAYVLGCGGAGIACVREAKERIATFLGAPRPDGPDDPHIPDLLQFHGLDTVPWDGTSGAVRLRASEYTPLGGFNAGMVIDTMRRSKDGRYREIERWWDSDIHPGVVSQGARQIRAVGRLAFYYGFRQFQRTFHDKLDRLRSIGAREEAERQGYEVLARAGQMKVYVITSLCGGTGSGMFMDVAAWVRHVLQDQAYLVAVLLMPSVFMPAIDADVQRRRIQANAYAALKEIEHIQRSPDAWRFIFPGEGELDDVRALFNRIYLVERENQNLETGDSETLSTHEEVYKLVGQQVALELCTELGKKFWEHDANVHLERDAPERSGGWRIYSGFANTALHLPTDLYRRQGVARLRAACLAALLDAGELDPADMRKKGEDAQATLRRLDDILRPGVFEDVEARSAERLTEALASIAEQANRYRDPHALEAYVGELRKLVEQRKQQDAAVARDAHDRPSLLRDLFGRIARRDEGDDEERRQERAHLRRQAKQMAPQLERVAAALNELRRAIEGRVQALRQWREPELGATLSTAQAQDGQRTFELSTDISEWLPGGPGALADGADAALAQAVAEEAAAEALRVAVGDQGDRRGATLGLNELDSRAFELRAARALGERGARSSLRDLLQHQPGRTADEVVRRAFQRCQPFWRICAERGFDRAELQAYRLVGLHEPKEWKALLRDVPFFDAVPTADPYALYAAVAVHGLAAEYIAGLEEMHKHYKYFCAQRGGPVHVFPRATVGDMAELAMQPVRE